MSGYKHQANIKLNVDSRHIYSFPAEGKAFSSWQYIATTFHFK
jgi:hypothetical protein